MNTEISNKDNWELAAKQYNNEGEIEPILDYKQTARTCGDGKELMEKANE